MVEDQLFNTRSLGLPSRLLRRGVVGQDIAKDMRQLRVLLALKLQLQQLDQLGLQGLMQQNIGAFGRCHQGRTLGGVATDHNRAAFVIKPVAHRGLNRRVVDAKGGYFEALVVQHHHLVALAHSWQRERNALAATAPGRHDALGMVGNAVAEIQHIGRTKAVDHLVNAGGAVNRRRGQRESGAPALQHEGRQAVDVV